MSRSCPSARAHPRSRGENSVSGPPACAARGSSPLTRGKLSSTQLNAQCPRLIPAHAGKTSKAVIGWPVFRAHPRSRGENSNGQAVDYAVAGSSPLTRGKRESVRRIEAEQVAHPRSRGENHVFDVGGREYSGSSPLTRGKPPSVRRWAYGVRLIPAHAGKTGHERAAQESGGAHPRSRGENANFLGSVVSSPGSSPLTRGKLLVAYGRIEAQGLIPAHAGKTFATACPGRYTKAHPRSRGENHRRSAPNGVKSGSSPLTRGKPVEAELRVADRGLIPAHAGKTSTPTTRKRGRRAHPRSRGENE